MCTALSLMCLYSSAACAPAPPASARGLARVQQEGVLRWGGDIQGGEPYVYEDPKKPGHLLGFDVEVAEALARELGVRAEFVQNDWSTLVPSLERGTFDVIVNGLEATPSRGARIALSRPYYVFQEVLSVRDGDARVSDLASLRGLRVGTLANTLAWEMLATSGAQRVPYEDVEETYLDLLHGRTDAVLLDDVVAERYGRKPGLHSVGPVGTGEYVVGVRRSEPELLHAVDRALAQIERSGELQRILGRWQLHDLNQAPAAVTATSNPPERAAFELGPHQLLLFLQGAWVTIAISMVAMLIAVVLGMLLALARLPSPYALRRVLAALATVYVEVFRGTPVLLQLYVLYYGLASMISLDAFSAAALGLGLNYAAYEAEIYRAGIQAVPHGEIEAARAMGMSGALTLRRVVMPHAVRFSLPGIANDFIALLKDSSLVSVITVVELTKRMTIAAVDGRSWLVPGILCAALYLVMSYPLSLLARRFEQHLGGHKR